MPLFQKKTHRRYSYKPVFYDEQKERIAELEAKLGAEEADSEKREERIRMAFRRNRPNPKEKRGVMKPMRLILYVCLVILLMMMVLNVKWLLF
ncbi:MAG: hypothetical protein LBC89_06585 [Bacteroidales bacterium]|jgi:cytochrome c-type biogenesis protein CcmH/NrfG|nr:hypothetical protein [Bacteroidales bacterium]